MASPPSAKRLFMDAVELPHRERAAFVARACGDDVELRRRVEALLAAHGEASAVMGEPAPPRERGEEEPGPDAPR